jgi:hypothetical protein
MRPLRIVVKDGWYHVCARGIDRKTIYTDTREETQGQVSTFHKVACSTYDNVLIYKRYETIKNSS